MSKPTAKVEESFTYGQMHQANPTSSIEQQEYTVDREYSLTMAGVTTMPGGNRAIVVDSDQENAPQASENVVQVDPTYPINDYSYAQEGENRSTF